MNNKKTITCKKCGNEVDKSNIACDKCGTPIMSEKDIKIGYRFTIGMALFFLFVCFSFGGFVNRNIFGLLLFLVIPNLSIWSMLNAVHKYDKSNIHYKKYATICTLYTILSSLYLLWVFSFTLEG